MKLFGDVSVLRGSVTWTRPFRLRYTPAAPPAAQTLPGPAAPEFDEDGRLYVFRFARTAPQQYSIDRERIFEYQKRKRLPDAGQRQIRRDVRNAADFFADVRDIQTPHDVLEP
jgi:hypothetical protein